MRQQTRHIVPYLRLSSQKVQRKEKSCATAPDQLPGQKIPRSFFECSPTDAAPLLLGKLLVHRVHTKILVGRIVEVEAYPGPHCETPDPAAHSYRGPTPRNQVLFGPAGHAYVYAIYGRYFCMNVSCEATGLAGCILLRALEPVTGIKTMSVNRGLPADAKPCELTSGPGRLCQALGLERNVHNGLDLLVDSSPLQIREDGYKVKEVSVTPRIGITVANDWPLRFTLPGHSCVSGPKSLIGTRVFLP